jgi:sensor histidine kinase regulating citrate/malate metabolism
MDYLIYVYIAVGVVLFMGLEIIVIRKYLNYLVDKRIYMYQNDLITKQCNEVENIYKQMRGWRHDYHNHIQSMKAYLALNQTDELGEYLDKLDIDLETVDTVIKTGNVMIDAVLNSKISIAKTKDIAVSAKAVVPKSLNIQAIDLCVIIGNLVDNAIEACLRQTEKSDRFIRIYIDIHKEMFYIYVANSIGGEIKKSGKSYLSTKDASSHGFGLMRIDKIVDKYNGFTDRQNEPGVFATEIMLPL